MAAAPAATRTTTQEQQHVEMDVTRLERVVQHIVAHSLGYEDAEEAVTIARILMYAQVRGNSQGVIKVLTNGVPSRSAAGATNAIATEHETKLSARLNGQGASGTCVP
jgi:hypothetical protein